MGLCPVLLLVVNHCESLWRKQELVDDLLKVNSYKEAMCKCSCLSIFVRSNLSFSGPKRVCVRGLYDWITFRDTHQT